MESKSNNLTQSTSFIAGSSEKTPLLKPTCDDGAAEGPEKISNGRGGWRAVTIIMVLDFLQHVAYFTVVTNMASLWYVEFKQTDVESLSYRMIFIGVCHCMSLVGGIMADVFVDKKKMLAVGFTAYLTGASLLEAAAAAKQWPVRENVAVAALALCVIGEACISPNLAVLGVTQLSKCEHNCELFMHMLYLSRNCGAFLVNTLLAFEIGLSNKGEYWKNFLPSLVATALAFVIYLTGLRIFKLDTKSEAGSETCRSFYLLASHVGWLKQSRTEQSYTLTSHIRDRKETAFDNLKKLVKIVLVNSSVFGFNIIYSQMLTTYGIQADSVLSPQHIQAPCAFMSSFNDTTVIILVAVILAMFSSRLRWRKLKVDLFSRMGIGLVCAVLSAFVAIVLEFERKKDCKANHGVSSLSVFVLIPQYALIGLGEILTLVSGMQLAYLGAPKGLRCTSLGLLKTALGLGDFTAYGVLELLERFNPDWYDHHDRCMSLNLGRTDDYLLFLVGLLVGCFIFFLIVARYVSTSDRISSRTRRNTTTLLGVTSQRTTSKLSVNNSNVNKEKD